VLPAFVLETVSAAKSFVENRSKSATGGGKLCHSKEGREPHAIHTFLAWPRRRVQDALVQLAAIERKELSKEAIEALASQSAATALLSGIRAT